MTTLLSYFVSLAASLRGDAIVKEQSNKIKKNLLTQAKQLKKYHSTLTLREEINKIGINVAKDIEFINNDWIEMPFKTLITDDKFQCDLASWLLEYDRAKRKNMQISLECTIIEVLRKGGISNEYIMKIKNNYFDLIEKQLFSDRTLSRWRHDISLGALHNKIDELLQQLTNSTCTQNKEHQKANLLQVHELLFKSRDSLLVKDMDYDVFVNRDLDEYFYNFLEQKQQIVFPVLGPGGTGKTSQIQFYLASLPPQFIPIVISARLLSDLSSSIKNKIMSIFPCVDPFKCVNLDYVLHDIINYYPNEERKILLVLDGINEYHFNDLSYEESKKSFIKILEILNKFNIHVIFSCRTFTWKEFLDDSGFRNYFFLSNVSRELRTEVVFDSVTGKFENKTIQKQVHHYGLELEDFNEHETQQYWIKLSKFIGASDHIRDSYKNMRNPFMLNILARYIENNNGTAPFSKSLLSEYINNLLAKESERERRQTKLLLIKLANKFIPESEETVFSSLTQKDVIEFYNQRSFNLILEIGLLTTSETETGQQHFFFRHDILLHYFVARAWSEKHHLEEKSLHERLLEIFKFSQKAILDHRNDYLREITLILINDFVGDANFCSKNDYLPGRCMFLLASALRYSIPKGFLCKITNNILMDKTWGTWISIISKQNIDSNEIGAILDRTRIDIENSSLIENLIILAPKATIPTALNFLKKLTNADSTMIIRMRCAFALGEISSQEIIPILINLLDLNSEYFTPVNNACLYSLSLINYKLQNDKLELLHKQLGSAWSLNKYIKRINAKCNSYADYRRKC